MTREELVTEINKEIDRRGGQFSMTKHDVAVYCYNLGVRKAAGDSKLEITDPKEIPATNK